MTKVNFDEVLAGLLETPMVIESGVSGDWTYRKWSDGVAECWCKKVISGVVNSAWGSCYTGIPTTLTYPSGLFNESPHVQITSEGDSSYASWVYCQTKGSATHTPQFTIIRATTGGTGSITFTANVYAKGKWSTYDPSTRTMDITGFSQTQMTKAEIRALIENSGNIYKDNNLWIPTNLE